MKSGFSAYAKRLFLLIIAVILFCGFSARGETVKGDLSTRFADEPHLEFDGDTYRMRRRVTTILFAGTDKDEASQGIALGARNGGQADFLLLLVIDEGEKKVTPIQINRDTMTEITILNIMGQVSGSRIAQICLAHGFGDGAEQSCELLTSAVSNFLKNTPIDYYFVMQLGGLGALNDVIGGIEVTLEDDFSAYDPQMTPGKTLTLNAEQTEIYLRQRYHIADESNISRQKRQQTYIRAASDKVMAKINESASFVDTLMDAIGKNAVTDMSRGRMLNMANLANRFEICPLRSVEGEDSLDKNGFVQFIADEHALMQLLIDVLYEKVD